MGSIVAGDRTADEIQSDIEHARASLADAVDQIAYRTNPKRVSESAKAALIARAQTPQGKAVIGGVGALLAIMVVRRFAKRGR
jgi:hypothetical protein